jgi:hypothetical protein
MRPPLPQFAPVKSSNETICKNSVMSDNLRIGKGLGETNEFAAVAYAMRTLIPTS